MVFWEGRVYHLGKCPYYLATLLSLLGLFNSRCSSLRFYYQGLVFDTLLDMSIRVDDVSEYSASGVSGGKDALDVLRLGPDNKLGFGLSPEEVLGVRDWAKKKKVAPELSPAL